MVGLSSQLDSGREQKSNPTSAAKTAIGSNGEQCLLEKPGDVATLVSQSKVSRSVNPGQIRSDVTGHYTWAQMHCRFAAVPWCFPSRIRTRMETQAVPVVVQGSHPHQTHTTQDQQTTS
ncbi:hypothetical protein Pelo_10295 [Pelomyxa schiedti]|nr:hypothetical protein Pelo_10295 [Pelomyxa schiedti]